MKDKIEILGDVIQNGIFKNYSVTSDGTRIGAIKIGQELYTIQDKKGKSIKLKNCSETILIDCVVDAFARALIRKISNRTDHATDESEDVKNLVHQMISSLPEEFLKNDDITNHLAQVGSIYAENANSKLSGDKKRLFNEYIYIYNKEMASAVENVRNPKAKEDDGFGNSTLHSSGFKLL